MARLSLLLLGGFEARLNEVSISGFTTDKSRAMLAYLAVERARSHRRQALAGLFWPGYLESSARASLRHVLANLRQVLSDDSSNPPFLFVEGETIQFNPASDRWLDVDNLRSLIKDDQPGQTTLQRLEGAVGLYRGAFLEGFSLKDCPEFDTWSAIVREELQRQVLGVLYQLAEGYEHQGELEKASGFARRQLELEPWLEEAHRQLMRLLALRGRRTAALAQYETCRSRLKEELGIEPSQATKTLFEQIRAGEMGKEAAAIPSESVSPAGLLSFTDQPRSKHNLPTALTSFIGRAAEMAHLKELMVDNTHRLVTLTGSGGTGKTRLALQVAAKLVDAFSDGVWLVELAPLNDPTEVGLAIAQMLGLHEVPGTPIKTVLAGYLQNKHLLLILDNAEHLLAECASLADLLLKGCPRLHMLATSREILNVSGETSFRVPSLSLTDPKQLPPLEQLGQCEAVTLFVERARLAQPGFTLNETNAAAVALICQRLDGIPLAIELAAARVRMMTPTEIAARLDNVFGLLTGGSRSLLPRQQTLKATIDWSYALLSLQERLALLRLSVFAGGWTLDGAEAVCAGEGIEPGEVFNLLAGLVDKSMAQTTSSSDGLSRYRMLETVRQYAREQLLKMGAVEVACDRHLGYYLRLAEEAGERLRGREQVAWLVRLEEELDDLRLALEWSLVGHGHLDEGLRLVSALMWFWHIREHGIEAVEWFEKLLDAWGAEQGRQLPLIGVKSEKAILVWIRAVGAYIYLASSHSGSIPLEQRMSMHQESIALCRAIGESADQELAWALIFGDTNLKDLTRPSLHLYECLEICRKKGYSILEAECLFSLSEWIGNTGDFQKGREILEESLAICRNMADPYGIARCLGDLEAFSRAQGDYYRARAEIEEARPYYQEIGNYYRLNDSYINQLFTELELGEDPEIFRRAEQALVFFRETQDEEWLCWILVEFSVVEWSRGNFDRAEELVKEVLAIRQTREGVFKPLIYHIYCRLILSQGDLARARQLLKPYFQSMTYDHGYLYFGSDYFNFLGVLSGLLSAEGRMARAVRILGALDESYHLYFHWIVPRQRHEHDATLSSASKTLSPEAFAEAWQAGQALTLQQAFEEAIRAEGFERT